MSSTTKSSKQSVGNDGVSKDDLTLELSKTHFESVTGKGHLGGVFLAVFVITGGTWILVFAQMRRDATPSHITNTWPGELGGEFWMHLITFGVGPLLGLLTTLFPSITDFVPSWLQPSMQEFK